MNIVIAAVVGGILLVWGGFLGLIRVVDMFERKHVLLLGAYTTLVVGCVMGLVLFTNYERQKENRLELQSQMTEFSTRLSELSTRLVSQLEEKADLTASEFEIRSRLQNEQEHHKRTRNELATQLDQNNALEDKVETERKARVRYQSETNKKLDERLQKEDQRYKNLSEVHRQSSSSVQKHLSGLKDELTRLQTRASSLENKQNTLLGKVSTAREIQDLSTQKLDALARSQAALYDDLSRTMAEVDSLYFKEFKQYKPQSP